MGQITAKLFEDLAEDADVHDRQPSREPTNKNWPPEAMGRNDRFKDKVFELLMLRARDFYNDMKMDERPADERYAVTEIKLAIWEKVVHPGNENPPEIKFKDRNGTVLFEDNKVVTHSSYARIQIEDYDHNHEKTIGFIIGIPELELGCGNQD
ncbi:MAG: hypothetical protein AAFX54_13855 [Pseudomonadota bacterium]